MEKFMKHGLRMISISLMSLIVSLFIVFPVLAVPPLPASFYGTVKINNSNVPDNTTIQALIGGQIYAEARTLTYQNDSVFSLNVIGDDTDTTAVDGGREGDTIQFKIGGLLADQTGVWHSGTNVNLDLTAASSEPISTPSSTSTPVPTQETIIETQPSPEPTPLGEASPTPETLIQPPSDSSETATAIKPQSTQSQATAVQPVSVTDETPPLATPDVVDNNVGIKKSGNISPVAIIIIAIGLIAILFVAYFFIFRKKLM
jgi:hypothetical protein